MAEQRAYFVSSEWAQDGCATLYQQPGEGKGGITLTAQRFPVFSLLVRIGHQETGVFSAFAWL